MKVKKQEFRTPVHRLCVNIPPKNERCPRVSSASRERAECQEGLSRSEEALKKLTLEIEPLKEEKAKLVAQLKQVGYLATCCHDDNLLVSIISGDYHLHRSGTL